MALSGGLRWSRRHRRIRAILVPLGLNLAALAFLAAVLASGSEWGALPDRWPGWLWPAGVSALAGVAVFRFPRSVGLPILVLAGILVWFTLGALKEFAPLDPLAVPITVQPLTDREAVTAFSWRADFISPPEAWPLPAFVLYRLRPNNSLPGEWWWPWAVSTGWARSVGAIAPPAPLKFGIYRLTLNEERPVWRLVKPELAPPP